MLRTHLDEDREYERILILDGALHVTGLHTNLLSCSVLDHEGYKINIAAGRCNGIEAGIMQINGVYHIQVKQARLPSAAGYANVSRHNDVGKTDMEL